ncbi:HutD family protein [Kutzneria viridogrisea]|uniref:HutD family protein n=2 Tax=Kutzneria viridogrisea TaxID=47990 RepID=A0ABR6BNP0_9PSEU|nr:hypothetical protein [Kutzneria viridogrisea]
MIVMRAGEHRSVPWRNGGGRTREIAVRGAGTDFDWRLSLAEVERDGPFSVFEGHERIITVVRGAGMELTVDGQRHVVRPHEPFRFAGGSRTGCRLLAGPVVNLNVMSRDGAAVSVGVPAELGGGTVAVVVLDGEVSVGGERLGPFDVALLSEEPGTRVVAVSADPMVAVVRLPSSPAA